MIVKIQKPLTGNGPRMALIYNEDRDFEMMTPWNGALDDLFDEDVKQYWEAKAGEQPGGVYHIDNILTLFNRVDDQPW